MKLRIEWIYFPSSGTGEVIEPCCSAFPTDRAFNVQRTDPGGQLLMGLAHGEEGAHFIPFKFCPSCGSPVIVGQEVTCQPQRAPQRFIGSGAITVFASEVPLAPRVGQ